MNKLIGFLFSIFLAINLQAQVMMTVDVLPTNVGGKVEFKRIFEQELQYPENALKNKIAGKTTITFTILKDSTVSDIRLTSSGNEELDKEAMRLFKIYQWVPAIKNGYYVDASTSVSFDFNPSKYPKLCKTRGYEKIVFLQDVAIDTTGKIYSSGIQLPAYPKGNFALEDFIKQNLEYPRQAQLSNIQGTVVLSFIVEPSGLPTNIFIKRSLGGGCDEEAIRILQLIKWYPGKYNEKFARVKMTFPFYFILNDEFKDNSAGEQK